MTVGGLTEIIVDFPENTQGAAEFIFNTENAAMFIVRFAIRYFFGVLVLIGLNFVAWDRSDTRPNEEADFNSQINFFTNPSSVTRNLYVTAGMTAGGMLMWFLPTLLWQGDPLPERKDVYNGIRDPDRQTSSQNSDSLIEQALRRNFSPNGILRLIMIDTVILLGQIFFWTLAGLYPIMMGSDDNNSRRRESHRQEDIYLDSPKRMLKLKTHPKRRSRPLPLPEYLYP